MMGTTRETLSRWFDSGVENGDAGMIILCDTFEYSDYPVYVRDRQDFDEKLKEQEAKSMTRVMETYDLVADKDKQMALYRCFAF